MPTRRTVIATAAASVALGLAAPPGPVRAQAGPFPLRDINARDGVYSDLARALEGRRITVEGFMAPPLKAESRFFVLTMLPMSVCPFCEDAAEWPDDIMAVYTKRVVNVVPFNVGIEVTGILELGAFRDPDTGFLSLLRLADATYG